MIHLSDRPARRDGRGLGELLRRRHVLVMFADNPAHANASTAPAVDHASAATDLGMARTNYTLHYALMTGLKPGFSTTTSSAA